MQLSMRELGEGTQGAFGNHHGLREIRIAHAPNSCGHGVNHPQTAGAGQYGGAVAGLILPVLQAAIGGPAAS